MTPDALTPLRCSACGTNSDGLGPGEAAPVSPTQVRAAINALTPLLDGHEHEDDPSL